MPSNPALADQLLDAQVAFHLEQLSGERLRSTVSELAEEILVAAGPQQIADLVDPEAAKAVARRALTTVPGSAVASGVVDVVVEVLRSGPSEPHQVGDLVDRAHVEAVLDAGLALHPVVERALDRLADSPLVGTVATRFMGRIVGEVLQANKAVADKVPGLGTLMSFGTSAASRVVGAADKQFEGLLGDTMGKSSAFAVRRLNRIVVETLQDPTTREAVLQVWDLIAEERVVGLGDRITEDEIGHVTAAGQDLVADVLASPHAADLVGRVIDGFFDHFGGYTVLELLEHLDLSSADLIDDLVGVAPAAVETLRATGDLERILRARLAPFYASREVGALLG